MILKRKMKGKAKSLRRLAVNPKEAMREVSPGEKRD